VIAALAAAKAALPPPQRRVNRVVPLSGRRLSLVMAAVCAVSFVLAWPFVANKQFLYPEDRTIELFVVSTLIAVGAAFAGTPLARRAGLATQTFARRGRHLIRYLMVTSLLAVGVALGWMLFWSFFNLAYRYLRDTREYPGNGLQLSGLFLETGIIEEAFFRWFLLSGVVCLLALAARRPAREIGSLFFVANLIVACIFSLAHFDLWTNGFDFGVFLNRVIMGLTFGTIYRRSGIEAAMVSHSIVDIVMAVVLTGTPWLGTPPILSP